ncbi:hypothetical protein CMT37_09095 [Elizabethkingia anophelis]|nr:hypothetical protein [Elizabethkingia anophelis]
MARTERKRQFKRSIAIVGDGITEKIYFEQLKELEQLKDVVIKPELPNKSSKGGFYKKALDASLTLIEKGYDHVYCLIDYDTILSENKENEFRKDIRNLDFKKITIYINNPCFETWILLHYENTSKPFKNCDAVCKSITKNLGGYSKNQKYLHQKNLYTTIRPHLETNAIPNAIFLERDRDDKSPNYPRAEIHKFFLKEKIIKYGSK